METELSRKLTQNVLTESLYFKAVIIKEEKKKKPKLKPQAWRVKKMSCQLYKQAVKAVEISDQKIF